MATGLPPPPINDQPGSFTWLEWYRKLRDYISTNGSVPWYIINFAGSNITDIATRDHDQLQNIDGGTAGEHYHLTSAQHAALTSGAHNDLTGLQGGTTNQYYHLTADEVRNARYTIEYYTPVTGFNYTIANTTKYLILQPSGSLASGTIKMPAAPVNGQVVSILCTNVVTSLTHTANTGQTILNPATSLTASGRRAWIYYTPTTTWYHVA